MTALIFSVHTPIQKSEEEVRSTLDPVDHGNPAAKIEEAPGFNEVETYPDNSQGVVRSHQAGGAYTPTEKYTPHWLEQASADHESRINRQVSSSGSAAAREEIGLTGHGTMMRTESIEPVIREGGVYGADYFAANVLGANETGGNYMTPQLGEPDMNAVAQAFANDNARAASQASVFGRWLGTSG